MTEQQALEKMQKDIILRNLSESTYKNYIRNVKKFIAFCNRPLEELDENDVRRFLEYLIVEKKHSPRTVNQHSSAIRFFFAVTLNRTMNYLQMPRFKKCKKLPDLLSREEAQSLIAACVNQKHKCWLLLAYGSGLRVSEIIALRVQDIDSQSMRIFVKGGKGGKDRYTLLSVECLNALRDYWLHYRPGRNGWMFPGVANSPNHVTDSALSTAFNKYQRQLGITKNVSMHSLRHAFATHLFEDGATLLQIKELLGHASLNSTQVYLHLANTTSDLVSPADRRCGDGG